MKNILLIFSAVLAGTSLSASGMLGWDNQSVGATVIDRIAEGQEERALRIYQSHFRDSDYEFIRLPVLARRRAFTTAMVVGNPLWRTIGGEMQLQFLRTHLENGPLTPRLERELLFHVYKIGSLEAISYLLAYAESGTSGAYLADGDGVPSLLTGWRKWWNDRFADGRQLLKDEGFVEPWELRRLAHDWLFHRFDDPADVVALVDARTPAEVLLGITRLLALVPGAKSRLRGQLLNKYKFFLERFECEEALEPREERG